MNILKDELEVFSINIRRVLEAVPFEGINEKVIILSTLDDVLTDLKALLENEQYIPAACDFSLKLVTLTHVLDIYSKMPNPTKELEHKMLDMFAIYNKGIKPLLTKHLH